VKSAKSQTNPDIDTFYHEWLSKAFQEEGKMKHFSDLDPNEDLNLTKERERQ